MKFKSRLLFSELCAAGAAALISAILVAGCATGERTGKFWDKGDVKNSDVYVATELGQGQSLAADTTSAPGSNGRIATVSGTQDPTTGRVAAQDFGDAPPAPPAPPVSDVPTVLPSKPQVSGAAAAGAAAGNAQSANSVAGAAQTVGGTTGNIVAPYVQKRAPSGVVNNGQHDGEIVNVKTVHAKELDPFALPDEPVVTPPGLARRQASAALAAAAPATGPPVAPAAAGGASRSNEGFLVEAGNAAPVPPAPPTGNQVPFELVPRRPAAQSVPAAAQATAHAFDSSIPQAAAATLPAGPTLSSRPATQAIVSAMPAAPVRPHSGIRLGDEDFDEDQQSATEPTQKPIVEPTATQLVPETHANAKSPYEADIRREAETSACVTPPTSPAARPAIAAPPAAPIQDTWESKKGSQAPEFPSPQIVVTRRPVERPAAIADSLQPPARPAFVHVVAAPQAAAPQPSATRATVPVKARIERQLVVSDVPEPARVHVDGAQTSGTSDAMICDSVSVHGRYTGDDSPAHVPLSKDPFESIPQRPCPTTVKPSPAKTVHAPLDGKSTSFWDDAFSTPKHTVCTADFSFPAPGEFQSDGAHSIVASAGKASGGSTRHSRSRALLVMGMLAGLVVSAVVLSRWRRRDEPDLSGTGD